MASDWTLPRGDLKRDLLKYLGGSYFGKKGAVHVLQTAKRHVRLPPCQNIPGFVMYVCASHAIRLREIRTFLILFLSLALCLFLFLHFFPCNACKARSDFLRRTHYVFRALSASLKGAVLYSFVHRVVWSVIPSALGNTANFYTATTIHIIDGESSMRVPNHLTSSTFLHDILYVHVRHEKIFST